MTRTVVGITLHIPGSCSSPWGQADPHQPDPSPGHAPLPRRSCEICSAERCAGQWVPTDGHLLASQREVENGARGQEQSEKRKIN